MHISHSIYKALSLVTYRRVSSRYMTRAHNSLTIIQSLESIDKRVTIDVNYTSCGESSDEESFRDAARENEITRIFCKIKLGKIADSVPLPFNRNKALAARVQQLHPVHRLCLCIALYPSETSNSARRYYVRLSSRSWSDDG